jgi:hypothetical protein
MSNTIGKILQYVSAFPSYLQIYLYTHIYTHASTCIHICTQTHTRARANTHTKHIHAAWKHTLIPNLCDSHSHQPGARWEPRPRGPFSRTRAGDCPSPATPPHDDSIHIMCIESEHTRNTLAGNRPSATPPHDESPLHTSRHLAYV